MQNNYTDNANTSSAAALTEQQVNRSRSMFMFTPEQTNWKVDEIPTFFQKRLDLRDKRLAYTEKQKREKKAQKADDILKKYFDHTSDADMYATKPLYGNMHPGSKRFEAILACRGGAQMGALTFKNCKRVSPLGKF